MRLDNNHSLIILITDSKFEGDILDDYEEFIIAHPETNYVIGFAIINTKTGFIPDEYADWYDTAEEAINDWKRIQREEE